jgi:hypothetical protein
MRTGAQKNGNKTLITIRRWISAMPMYMTKRNAIASANINNKMADSLIKWMPKMRPPRLNDKAPLEIWLNEVATPVLAAVLIFVTKRGNPQCGHVCALSEISLSHSGHFVIIRAPSYL